MNSALQTAYLWAAVLLCVLTTSTATWAQSSAAEPEGQLKKGTFASSEVFPGTTRPYSVYIPKQYDSSSPASLMVFMDGTNYAKPNGSFRVPQVFDQLIASGKMPVTIAVFVDPGKVVSSVQGGKTRSNRSFEYDSLGDRYSRFLINEFLPVALADLNVSPKPSDRAVCGISSGGICAFTTAWERPDVFGKVMSHIGSFTNIRGGWAYPGLVRKTKSSPKQLKVYLQEGMDDLSNLHGNWPLGNQDLAAALQYAGYHFKLEMTEGGHSGKWAGEVFPEALAWLWNEDSTPTVFPNTETKPKWTPHEDAVRKADVPRGTLTSMPDWEDSKIFPGTTRQWSVYVPKQYDASKPTPIMVFQDGIRFADEKGRWRVPIVFDNLIAAGAMPPTIGVFINPGHDMSKPRKGRKSSNRSFEYDSLGQRYANFVLREILPMVEAQYNVSKAPAHRAIGGSSSGAICAFTAAWEYPDQFSKVYSNVGSFTNLRGGNVYPALVRKTEPKRIRVFMSDTSGDIDNAFGSWPWSNQRMSSALTYMGYDHRFVWAEGYAHNADFGSQQFPDAMRWLWRDESHKPSIDTPDDLGGDLTLLNLLPGGNTAYDDDATQWETVVDGLGFADAPCSDDDGNFYFCDMRAPGVYKIDVTTGKRSKLADLSLSGLDFAPDGVLYGCSGKLKQVIKINLQDGSTSVVAKDVTPNDLVVSNDFIYITETRAGNVTRINRATGEKQTVASNLKRPNGITLTNDNATLAVSASGDSVTWTFRVARDGSLDAQMPTMPMRLKIDLDGEFKFNMPPPYLAASRGDGMCVDARGRFYVTSAVGIQVFDPTSRPCGVLATPDPTQPLTSCVLGGEGHSYLYVTNGKAIYRRKLSIQ